MLKSQIITQLHLANLKGQFEGLKERFTRDRDGAALIEYSILIGLITVGAVATIGLVGTWVGTQWTNLKALLP